VDQKTVGLRELGQNVSQVLAVVKEGRSLVVTEHGRPIAEIVPIGNGASFEDRIRSGEITPARGDIMELLAQPIPSVEGMTASEALQEMRDLEW
jgi:prevent-host-death family protein